MTVQTTVAFHVGVEPCPGGVTGTWTGRRGFQAVPTGLMVVLPLVGLAIVVWMLRGRGLGPHPQITRPVLTSHPPAEPAGYPTRHTARWTGPPP
ncbi:hypothetical protein [Wenjunlia tyrosinilytica]|uniref:Uncharacterized protein n=1 Tax=Wenjunlia tyrosinilytica TaxID=1544741 RepID=A0A917ZZH9_9ACTN|nr:hypothetical protein [Wenjunlia tyrosinilytica]GGP00416.1 hypothetical protein GCM10012280_69130 [Wenjunlia tyrosinilytica]